MKEERRIEREIRWVHFEKRANTQMLSMVAPILCVCVRGGEREGERVKVDS